MLSDLTVVAADELSAWDGRLLETEASYMQYPYWNQSMQSWRLRASYLTWGPERDPQAWVCVLSFGLPRLRIGMIREGPVWLRELDPDRQAACLDSLVDWLRGRGFVFATFANMEDTFLERIENLGPSDREKLFPFPVDDPEALLIPQGETDEDTWMRFSPVGRRDIRKARDAGFIIEHSDTEAALDRAWPIWKKVHRDKNVYRRSRASYSRLLAHGRPHGLVCIYTAAIDGTVVQAILVVRARSRSHYIIGSLDRDALGDRPSPSCLLHFRAMRDFHALGAGIYDIGSRSGPVFRFKSKFRPREHAIAPPVNLILDPDIYPACRAVLPRLR